MTKWIAALTVLFSTQAFADQKIGIVDVDKAISQLEDGQKLKKTLEEEFKKRQEILQKMQAKMGAMAEEFERKATILSADAKDKQRRELMTEQKKFQDEVAKSQGEMDKRREELIRPIVSKLNGIISDLAKKEGIDLVISRPDQLILFAKKEIDLTEKVVREYNKG